MDGLSGAASVIAVIQLADRILTLCGNYARAVKDAKKDIECLHKEVKSVTEVLQKLIELLRGPNGTKLSASQSLDKALMDCSSELKGLERRLHPGKKHKVMRSIGLRALKWPLESNNVEKVVNNLERYKQLITLALQVDQT
jgi:hypothetical protein